MDHNTTKLQAKNIPIEDVFRRLNVPGSSGKYHCINPDHQDKHPSLSLYPKTNTFYCFSCNASGDTITAYMLAYGINFVSALERMKSDFPDRFSSAIKTNIKIAPALTATAKKDLPAKRPNFLCSYDEYLFDERAGIYEDSGKVERSRAEEMAMKYVQAERLEVNKRIFNGLYQYCKSCFPYGIDGKAYNYLVRKRELSENIVMNHKIFSLRDHTSAQAFLFDLFDMEELKGAGLVDSRNQFLFKDTHRLIIPYLDNSGDIIYLRARYFDKDGNDKEGKTASKYIGLRNDSTNLNRAKRLFNFGILEKISHWEEVYIYEGELDALSGETAGRNSIAIPGANNFPFDEIKRLRRFKIILGLDNDKAGAEARQKIIDEFAKANKRVDIVIFPEGVKDMNELLMLGGSNG